MIWIFLLLWIMLKFQFAFQSCRSEFLLVDECDSDCSLEHVQNVICEDIITYNTTNIFLEIDSTYTVTSLLFINSTLTILSNSVFNSLRVNWIEKLYLRNTRIDEIKRKTLNNFLELILLDIAENKITKLYQGTFDKLTQLRYLNLSHNIISTMEDELFLNIKLIETIDLSYNNLSEINYHLFHTNQNLISLNIANNYLMQLHHRTFDGLGLLRYLNLSYNLISSIKDDTFFDLQSIQTIDLSYNSILEIDGKSFYNNGILEFLDIAENLLTNLYHDTFSRLFKLKLLNLRHNLIQYMDNDTFSNLKLIDTIDLSYNKLYRITNKIFQNNKNLILLLINNNQIQEINDFAFNNLSNLRLLNLSLNNVSAKNMIMNITSSIYCFDLSFNIPLIIKCINVHGVVKIHHSIFKSKTEFGDLITELDLSSTMISLDAFSFHSAKNLKSLFLDDVNLKILNEDLFVGLVQLKYLSLINNNLTTIPTGVFRTLRNLRSLSLNINNIAHLEFGIFNSLGNLTKLNLARNRFYHLDVGILYNLQNIEYINLSNNSLSFVDFNDLVFHMHRKNKTGIIQVALDNNVWLCSWLFKVMSLARKNNFIILEGYALKVRNVHGIACKNNKINFGVTSELSKTITTQNPVTKANAPRITRSTTANNTLPQTNQSQEAIKGILTTYTSEITTTVNQQPIKEISSAVKQHQAVGEKYLLSTESSLLDATKRDSNQQMNSEFRVLLAFSVFLNLLIIFSIIYFKYLKNIKLKPDSKEISLQTCNIELIDSNENDDNEL